MPYFQDKQIENLSKLSAHVIGSSALQIPELLFFYLPVLLWTETTLLPGTWSLSHPDKRPGVKMDHLKFDDESSEATFPRRYERRCLE